jgi:hypothetical protein
MTAMTHTIKCGKCRGRHETVQQVRECKGEPKQPARQDTLFVKPRRGPVTEDGMYRLGETVYKVQIAVHGSGKLYAKRLVHQSDDTWRFVFESGAIRKLGAADKMTLEEAKAFGKLYEVCCVCGATLTDDSPGGSIEQGIGPICAGKVFG